MVEETMPATEATAVAAMESEERDPESYELAFHILPTVAEEEVPSVFETLKTLITKEGGDIFDKEDPEMTDLAYPVYRSVEGRNVPFTSAYFGWVRFRVVPHAIEEILNAIASDQHVLRHLLIKLTKAEEAHPYYYHEAKKAEKMVVTVEEEIDQGISRGTDDDLTEGDEKDADDTTADEKSKTGEEPAEVDDEALEEALKKPEA